MIAVSTTLHNYLTVTTDNINIGKIQGNVSIIETRNDVWALWSPLVKRSVMVERAVHVPQSLYSSDSFTTSCYNGPLFNDEPLKQGITLAV